MLAALALPAPAQAATAPYCGITWGSTAEGDLPVQPAAGATITDVRSGQHACFDRLVLEVAGPAPDYRVEYVSQVTADGSGAVVPLRGGAYLQVTAGAVAYDRYGRPTFGPIGPELVDVAGYRTFRQATYAGSFEGLTTLGVGVRARLPFRVFVLDGPGTGHRLVLDVAHAW
ncbi:hypothetical protein ACI797_03640 [Geodermatophilus sp. SYSU D00691]